MEHTLPLVKVAAVQAASAFLDLEDSLRKVEALAAEAAENGAELVAFGESFVAGFPIWGSVLPPVEQHDLHERLFATSIIVPGPETERLGRVAASHGIVLSVGVNERHRNSLGQVFNTNLIFDRDGKLVNHRRKLVATWAERLTWSHGDGYDLEPVDLGGWKLGALICGENTNTLARYSLLAQGERLHIATYPPSWPFDTRADSTDYDLAESIRLRSAAHSFEGKVFSVVAATILDDEAVATVAQGDPTVDAQLRSMQAVSMIIGPRGETVAAPIDGEGILYATVDLAEEVVLKRAHDIVGTYNRFDVFSVRLDKTRHEAITVLDGSTPATTTQSPGDPVRELVEQLETT